MHNTPIYKIHPYSLFGQLVDIICISIVFKISAKTENSTALCADHRKLTANTKLKLTLLTHYFTTVVTKHLQLHHINLIIAISFFCSLSHSKLLHARLFHTTTCIIFILDSYSYTDHVPTTRHPAPITRPPHTVTVTHRDIVCQRCRKPPFQFGYIHIHCRPAARPTNRPPAHNMIAKL